MKSNQQSAYLVNKGDIVAFFLAATIVITLVGKGIVSLYDTKKSNSPIMQDKK